MDTRSSERTPVFCQIMARAPATPVPITVLDISRTGCKIESKSPLLQVGGTVLLDFTHGQQAAGQVVWHQQGSFGIRFYRALSAHSYAQLTEDSPRPLPMSNFGDPRPQEQRNVA